MMLQAFISLVLAAAAAESRATHAGKCPDHAMGQPATGAKLVADCIRCISASTKAGCTSPKFCPGITGEPWCGSAKNTQCDSGPGALPGSLSLECCHQYVNETVGKQCGSAPECPDKQMSQKEYEKLDGDTVSELCEACFTLGKSTGCQDTHFCAEETGFPWCSDKEMECDQLGGTDKTSGVTAAMGVGCCAKYRQDNTSTACGGMPCPDSQASDASKDSCVDCFAAGAKQNCSEISFCTSTHFGQLPWCGPRDGPNFPVKSCDGTEIFDVENCKNLQSADTTAQNL